MVKRTTLSLVLTVASGLLLSLPFPAPANKTLSAPRAQRFEVTLKSSVTYPNPGPAPEMRVLFVSPLGETNRVYGFWDGGKTWRVRFQPNFPGRWTYYTMCSDTTNQGLHEQRGEFLCLAATGESRFDRHGPLQVNRSQQYLEHADRTPFLWLGDAAGFAAIKATPTDWDEFIKKRARQKFNVVQWRLNPERPAEISAASSAQDYISANLDLFRQLDAKIATANRAGLLSAIAPLWEISDRPEAQLPEAEAIRLFRYAVARWGADHVAWIVAFESDSTGAPATRWQNIGRAVFNQVNHAPVVLLPGESFWALDAFRNERWVDVLGLQTANAADDNSLPWLLHGPLAQERKKIPTRPLITLAPPAEVASAPNSGEVTAERARRLLWWSVLLNTPAGVSYQAKAVAAWTSSASGRSSLALPGAEAIAPLADGLGARNFGQLEPNQQALAGTADPALIHRRPTVVHTKNRDLTLLYAPEAQTLQLAARILPAETQANWLNPRTGEVLPASATNEGAGQRFATPAPGDWVLVLQKLAGKPLVAGAKKAEPKIDKPKRD